MTKLSKNTQVPQCDKTAVMPSVIFAKHLRIGNYVYFNNDNYSKGRISEIRESIFVGMDKVRLNNVVNKLHFVSNLKPILISESLLELLGASRIDFKDFPSYNLKGIQINCVNGIWIEYVSQVEILGLHHLQNIFYFRMNEELCVPL
jgi:hypothetical protein